MAISPLVWFENQDGEEGENLTVRYSRIFFLALAYLAVPLLLGSIFNRFGWESMIWVLLLVMTLVDFWVIFHPWAPIGISIAGYISGQVGGTPGPNVKEGTEKAWEWLKNVYGLAAAVILGKQIALVTLAFLSLDGFGGVALIVLAIVLLVILGNVLYSKKPWVIRWFWYFYCGILVVLMLYWVVGTFYPELRQSAAKASAHSVATAVAIQHDNNLKKEVELIGSKIGKMPEHLTLEERVTRLSPDEQKIWRQAERGSFVEKSADAAMPMIGKTASTMGGGLMGIIDDFFYAKTLEIEVATMEPYKLCGIRPGKREFNIPKGREVEVFIAGEKTDITSTVRVNKTFPGETFVVGKGGCVDIFFSVNADFQKNKFVRQVVAIAFK
ncbi:MAG: hypothetical protein Q8Q10_00145 [bacterium]|nr:hypothetical protein [bacterium]